MFIMPEIIIFQMELKEPSSALHALNHACFMNFDNLSTPLCRLINHLEKHSLCYRRYIEWFATNYNSSVLHHDFETEKRNVF